MEIRLATMEDYDAFNDMYIHFPEDFLLEKMPKERFRPYVTRKTIYLAIKKRKVVGYAIVFGYKGMTADIIQFYVTPNHEGQGKEFYQLLEKEMQKKNFTTLYLQCYRSEKVVFWQERGFVRIRNTEKFVKELK